MTESAEHFFNKAFLKTGLQPLQVIANPAMIDAYVEDRMARIEENLKAAIDVFMETGKSPMIDMGDGKCAFIGRGPEGEIVAYVMNPEQAARFHFPEVPEDGKRVIELEQITP